MKEFWKKYRIYYKEFGIECFRRCHHGFLKLLKRELSRTPEFPSKKEREEGRGGGGGGRDRVGIRVRAERRRPFPHVWNRLARWPPGSVPRVDAVWSAGRRRGPRGSHSATRSPQRAPWRALGTRYLRDSELTLFFIMQVIGFSSTLWSKTSVMLRNVSHPELTVNTSRLSACFVV